MNVYTCVENWGQYKKGDQLPSCPEGAGNAFVRSVVLDAAPTIASVRIQPVPPPTPALDDTPQKGR